MNFEEAKKTMLTALNEKQRSALSFDQREGEFAYKVNGELSGLDLVAIRDAANGLINVINLAGGNAGSFKMGEDGYMSISFDQLRQTTEEYWQTQRQNRSKAAPQTTANSR